MLPDIALDDIFQLETSRLWLRWPRASDAAAIARFAAKKEVAETTAAIPHPYPAGAAEEFVLHARQRNAIGQSIELVAVLNRSPRQLIGTVAIRFPEGGLPLLGYAFDSTFWRQGFATEAAGALIDTVFMLTDIPAIAAHVMPDNRASARVLEKLGFSWRRRALSDQPGRCSNGPMDRFELDRAEWYAQRGFGATTVSGASILPEPAAWSEKRAEA
ncbi:MAG: GNAT family N-acetyltransferase [Beijerinckiaceae bacterium]|nr:GNAT family N-acetyltransferase [Beijerinckiaceae bacterium]